MLKIGSKVKLLKKARNVFKIWDKGEVVEVVKLKSNYTGAYVEVKDSEGNTLSIDLDEVEAI